MVERLYTVVLIVPTGIGAAIGGYAGDALPVARAIASCCDRLITHPNVLNGASLYWPLPNSFYVEGYGLDKFAAGCWGLRPVHQNRIGLILDRAIEPDLRWRHLQAADAARATLGLNLTDYVVTDAPLGVELRTSASGASWGTIQNPDSLLRAAEVLITQARANAIAVVARFPEDIESEAAENYRQGKGVDPVAGAEAIISHLIVRTFQIPCAHAPACSPPPLSPHLSPRSAAEELGYTFLPCVLVGLSHAPQFVTPAGSQKSKVKSQKSPNHQSPNDIWADQVDALIVPATACGGSAILSLSQLPVQIIAVEENQTQMQVPPEQVGIEALRVHSYLEALGALVAHRAGISPSALSPDLSPIRSLPKNW
ncbi:DUF3326 domain-containing protein [Argonema galeatum]|uniref:DUF3326 domain-containing protein n=1 Tax=Argonema galeatum TaxID=2942762 RepID=UPI002013398B|nr:DUF3326 domain-containing protein [Argonema galeatum]MCL1467402.1 DUF3326 domain-containing protein [Argonema galeatum A003/A1]